MDPLMLVDSEARPWRTRVWSAIVRWADWLIILFTLLGIAGGIAGLIWASG